MKIKQVRPGYFVLFHQGGYPMPINLARVIFNHMAKQLELA